MGNIDKLLILLEIIETDEDKKIKQLATKIK